VTVTLDESDNLARLTVANDGAVIPPDMREHVFERFARLDEARTRDAGGSGLGLAITRDIVERHGGTIRVADGQPTRFVVELPLRG
jgi:signal transduction histidine kinase